MVSIENLTTSIREFPSFFVIFRKNERFFSQTCAALDVIEDTELAIQAYENASQTSSDGIKYLLAYGFLQAVYVQQDAIKNLAESLDCPFPRIKEWPQKLQEIREIRNDAIGHPTKRDRARNKSGPSYHHISRITLSNEKLTLMSVSPEQGKPKFQNIEMLQISRDQRYFVEKYLSKILANLKSEENSHRRKFMEEKLSDIFKHLGYKLEKIKEGIRNINDPHLPLNLLKSIEGMARKLKGKLKERGEEFQIQDVMDELEHPILELKKYLEAKKTMNPWIAPIIDWTL